MIAVDAIESVVRITIDRPEKRNALSPDLLSLLVDAFDSAVDDPDCSVVLLRAEGTAFSAGFDLTGRYGEGKRPEDPWTDREHLRRMTRVVEAVWNCPLPVVAAVQGACLAGGADLVLHCDFVLMAEGARVGYPPARFLGTPPSHMWIHRVGLTTSRRVLLAGEQITSDQATTCGLAQRVVPAERLSDTALDFALNLASCGRELLISNKWVINRGIDLLGRSVLNRIAESEDALAHTSPASRSFKERAGRDGVGAALRSSR